VTSNDNRALSRDKGVVRLGTCVSCGNRRAIVRDVRTERLRKVFAGRLDLDPANMNQPYDEAQVVERGLEILSAHRPPWTAGGRVDHLSHALDHLAHTRHVVTIEGAQRPQARSDTAATMRKQRSTKPAFTFVTDQSLQAAGPSTPSLEQQNGGRALPPGRRRVSTPAFTPMPSNIVDQADQQRAAIEHPHRIPIRTPAFTPMLGARSQARFVVMPEDPVKRDSVRRAKMLAPDLAALRTSDDARDVESILHAEALAAELDDDSSDESDHAFEGDFDFEDDAYKHLGSLAPCDANGDFVEITKYGSLDSLAFCQEGQTAVRRMPRTPPARARIGL
jgi:hypothetical protein